MIKLVINLSKAVVAVVATVLFSSCNMNITSLKKVDGSGNVVARNRAIAENFTSVTTSNGLEVILEQSATNKVEVVADDNLHEHIKTEVTEGELRIYADVSIRDAKSKKVYVQMAKLNSLETSSGSSVTSTNVLENTSLDLSASSGSEIDIKINASAVTCASSSGSEIKLSGKAEKLETESSSGSSIDASALQVKSAVADSSSGSNINLNATENITAQASSGSSINYVEKPATLNKKTSSGGSVSAE